jgi:hypothetical protein
MTKTLRAALALVLVAVALLAHANRAAASITAQAAREAADFVAKRFGSVAAKEGVEKLAVRIERAAAQYGDNAVTAVKNVGPRALHLADDAGANGAAVVRLAAQHGQRGLVLAENPRTFALVVKHGDEAAEAIVKHPSLAEPLIEAHGKEAAKALTKLSEQSGRKLEMLREGGELTKLGRTDEVLQTVGRFGDRGMDFIWKHKGALAATAVMATFLADPESYISGAKDITKIAVENIARPLAELPKDVATEMARSTDWTPVALTIVGVVAALFAIGMWIRRRPRGT